MAESLKTGSDEFGEAVRRARERRGMSRRDLAESTGLSYPYISQIETGYRMPSTPAMRTLADALGLRPDSLFDALRSAPSRDTPSSRAPAPAPAVPHTAASRAGRPSIAPSPVSSPAGGTSAGAAPRAFSATSTGSAAREAGTAGDPGTGDLAAGAPAGAPADLASGAPADLASGAPGGWIANRSFRRNPTPPAAAAPAAPAATPSVTAHPAAAPAAVPNPSAPRDRAIDQASALLTALPAAERLPALTEIQARVVRSVVEDEVRRNAVR
ncbi:helix-turn-helix domain-containing protein [Nakamurella sp.]|uniref:helix-turn-helix domain-containing protein n=1 Tax=Nakamurella sp. TaxID=1869182 RepID=UPI003783C0A7